MKRKTNLFYTDGVDSKFLTFSNYTEAMTGNYLSTNIRLFPTLFLCVKLNIQDKEGFIKNHLVAYYENKLATLRDANKKDINPLGYLLDCIFTVDSNAQITYIGNITEQDYNGIYTDTICTINPIMQYTGSITESNSNVDNPIEGDASLRGWYNSNGDYTGPKDYATVTPEFDSSNLYNINSNHSLNFEKNENNPIEFNVIIPLFSVVDTRDSADLVNYNINYNATDGEIIGDSTTNVPLGIWFANDTISLSTDGIYGQNWSLVIGSQFKPFPTSSTGIPTEIEMNNTPGAYNSFAQVLARQDSIIKFFSEQIQELKKQINEMKQSNTLS